jgi:hypothetical protein
MSRRTNRRAVPEAGAGTGGPARPAAGQGGDRQAGSARAKKRLLVAAVAAEAVWIGLLTAMALLA